MGLSVGTNGTNAIGLFGDELEIACRRVSLLEISFASRYLKNDAIAC